MRVDVDAAKQIDGYIKNVRCAFQVKAENFTPGKIAGEMAPMGVLRPAIVDLANDAGAYVIVSTRDNVSDSSLAKRVAAMVGCLSHHGLSGKPLVDFYDCRKLADWVEQHPPIANWIRFILGKPLVGWKSYSPWAYLETDIEAEYLIDDRVKVFMPDADDGSDARDAINRLRGNLSKNVSIRIVGLSGVGKTRLVQALFDKRIVTEQPALDAETVLYADLSDNPTPQPNAMIEALVTDEADCIVVIDNCGPDVHTQLTQTVKRPGGRVRLVTIEYDVRDDLPEGTIVYRLEGSSDDILKVLMKRRFAILSDSDLDKIAEFSDGNARVAFALASTTETTGELARLRDSELFKRLFDQKNAANDTLLRNAEIASLLYSFDGQSTSTGSELAILASLSDISINTFSRNIAELQRRGLIQARGQWRAVLPHAISNRLAAQAIEALPVSVLINALVEGAPDRVARSFSRRLGYLHESKAVRGVVQEWLKPGGRYGDIATLSEIGRQIFENIAPVHQEASLDALDRATLNADFISTNNHNRSRFARIARSLAYEPEMFDQAVKVLERFALAEPEGYKNNSTRDMLKSLFYCHLSGTEALSGQRAKNVRTLLLADEEERRTLGILLLEAALEGWHFSSFYGFDFGARKRSYGFSPRSDNDVLAWYEPFIDIAVEVGKTSVTCWREARMSLAKSARGLWTSTVLNEKIVAAAVALSRIDGWPDGWVAIRSILQYDKDKIDAKSLQKLIDLEQALAPRELKTKIGARVLARGAFLDDLDDESDDASDFVSRYSKAEREAENLGRAAADEDALLSELLPELLGKHPNNKLWSFGFGVGLQIQDAAVLVAKIRHLTASAIPSIFSLLFFHGFISGWHRAKPKEVAVFLDGALNDEVWGKWFPELQLRVHLDNVGYERILKSLELDNTPVWQYRYLSMGRATDPLTVDQISTLVHKIAAKSDGGLLVAIEILCMVVHCAKDKSNGYRHDLALAGLSFIQELDWSKIQNDADRIGHDIDEILGFALATPESAGEVQGILHNLLAFKRSISQSYSHNAGELLIPFLKSYPKQALDAIYIADEDGQYRTAYRIVSLLANGERATAIIHVSDNALIEWCEISPEDRYVFAAQTCCLFEKQSAATHDGTEDLAMSRVAMQVFGNSRDKQAVLKIFVSRLLPGSWSGSLSLILKRRLPLLAKMNLAGDDALQVIITREEELFKKKIAVEEANEEAEERQRTGSFE